MPENKILELANGSYLPKPDANPTTTLRCALLNFLSLTPPSDVDRPFFDLDGLNLENICWVLNVPGSKLSDLWINPGTYLKDLVFQVTASITNKEHTLKYIVPMFYTIEARATALIPQDSSITNGLLVPVSTSIRVKWPQYGRYKWSRQMKWDALVKMLQVEGDSRYNSQGEEFDEETYRKNLLPQQNPLLDVGYLGFPEVYNFRQR